MSVNGDITEDSIVPSWGRPLCQSHSHVSYASCFWSLLLAFHWVRPGRAAPGTMWRVSEDPKAQAAALGVLEQAPVSRSPLAQVPRGVGCGQALVDGRQRPGFTAGSW